MDWVHDDGGRADAGFHGTTGDCVTRAVAIGTGLPYKLVYVELNIRAQQERPRGKGKRSSSRTGVHRRTYEKLLFDLGWFWTPTMAIGQGCTVHLRADELPEDTLIARVSRHVCTVINGVVHDIFDPSRDGERCVYGYYQPTVDSHELTVAWKNLQTK